MNCLLIPNKYQGKGDTGQHAHEIGENERFLFFIFLKSPNGKGPNSMWQWCPLGITKEDAIPIHSHSSHERLERERERQRVIVETKE